MPSVELALAHEDLVAGALAARKSSTPAVHNAALKRLRTVRADIALLAKTARPAKLTAAQRHAYETYYDSLVENAGYRLDAAYEQGTVARDRMEAALAPPGSRIAAERRADDVLLRTIGG